MSPSKNILQWSLLFGAAYFTLVSAAHWTGRKIPMLFIYFDVPSHIYQDRIISLFTLGWSFFFLAARRGVLQSKLDSLHFLLSAGSIAVLGIALINLLTNFQHLSNTVQVSWFWLEWLFLAVYLLWLLFFYWLVRKELSGVLGIRHRNNQD